MPKKKGQIEPPKDSLGQPILAFNIETELVRHSEPTIVKATFSYGPDKFQAHGIGDSLELAEDRAIERVKNLMKSNK